MAWTHFDPDMTDRPDHDGRRHLLQEDIRRHTLELLDRRWHQLWGSFGVSVILLGFGAKLLWMRPETHWPQALALIAVGAMVWLLHRGIWQLWTRSVQQRDDWLIKRDQACVALMMWASVFAPAEADWWPVPMAAGSVYGVWKLLTNARQHWPSWFFSQARTLMRQRREH
jgi:hypothetical protein